MIFFCRIPLHLVLGEFPSRHIHRYNCWHCPKRSGYGENGWNHYQFGMSHRDKGGASRYPDGSGTGRLYSSKTAHVWGTCISNRERERCSSRSPPHLRVCPTRLERFVYGPRSCETGPIRDEFPQPGRLTEKSRISNQLPTVIKLSVPILDMGLADRGSRQLERQSAKHVHTCKRSFRRGLTILELQMPGSRYPSCTTVAATAKKKPDDHSINGLYRREVLVKSTLQYASAGILRHSKCPTRQLSLR
jgi:hypothetical protein